jgi:hypothetical protein
LRLRQAWIEKLGLDLIIENAKNRYDIAVSQNWLGRILKMRFQLEEFLKQVI